MTGVQTCALPISAGWSKPGCAVLKVEQNLQNLEKCSTAASKFRVRDIESRTKSSKIWKNVLPPPPNLGCATSKVEQNHPKLKKCSTAASKFKMRGTKSRTKSPKIEKMFYSVTFARAVWSQITDTSMKMDSLSVKFERNPGAPPKIRKNLHHDGADFHHYSVAYGVITARFHTLSKSGSDQQQGS